MIPTIKTVRVAHNIGFSSALNCSSSDGYVEASRWRFGNRKVHKAFLKGWSYGYQLRKEVQRENIFGSRLSLQASDFSGDGTVEMENIMGLA